MSNKDINNIDKDINNIDKDINNIDKDIKEEVGSAPVGRNRRRPKQTETTTSDPQIIGAGPFPAVPRENREEKARRGGRPKKAESSLPATHNDTGNTIPGTIQEANIDSSLGTSQKPDVKNAPLPIENSRADVTLRKDRKVTHKTNSPRNRKANPERVVETNTVASVSVAAKKDVRVDHKQNFTVSKKHDARSGEEINIRLKDKVGQETIIPTIKQENKEPTKHESQNDVFLTAQSVLPIVTPRREENGIGEVIKTEKELSSKKLVVQKETSQTKTLKKAESQQNNETVFIETQITTRETNLSPNNSHKTEPTLLPLSEERREKLISNETAEKVGSEKPKKRRRGKHGKHQKSSTNGVDVSGDEKSLQTVSGEVKQPYGISEKMPQTDQEEKEIKTLNKFEKALPSSDSILSATNATKEQERALPLNEGKVVPHSGKENSDSEAAQTDKPKKRRKRHRKKTKTDDVAAILSQSKEAAIPHVPQDPQKAQTDNAKPNENLRPTPSRQAFTLKVAQNDKPGSRDRSRKVDTDVLENTLDVKKTLEHVEQVLPDVGIEAVRRTEESVPDPDAFSETIARQTLIPAEGVNYADGAVFSEKIEASVILTEKSIGKAAAEKSSVSSGSAAHPLKDSQEHLKKHKTDKRGRTASASAGAVVEITKIKEHSVLEAASEKSIKESPVLSDIIGKTEKNGGSISAHDKEKPKTGNASASLNVKKKTGMQEPATPVRAENDANVVSSIKKKSGGGRINKGDKAEPEIKAIHEPLIKRSVKLISGIKRDNLTTMRAKAFKGRRIETPSAKAFNADKPAGLPVSAASRGIAAIKKTVETLEIKPGKIEAQKSAGKSQTVGDNKFSNRTGRTTKKLAVKERTKDTPKAVKADKDQPKRIIERKLKIVAGIEKRHIARVGIKSLRSTYIGKKKVTAEPVKPQPQVRTVKTVNPVAQKPPSFSKQAVNDAIINLYKKQSEWKRKELIGAAIGSLGLSEEQLADRSSGSLCTKLKSLAGSIITEMIDQNLMEVNENDLIILVASVEDTKEQVNYKNEIIKLLKEKEKLTRIQILNVFSHTDGELRLNIRNLAGMALKQLEDASEVERNAAGYYRLKTAAKYPATPIGAHFTYAETVLEQFKKGRLSARQYEKRLMMLYMRAINILGSEFMEYLSLYMVKTAYGVNVVKDELTAGPNDNGIDGRVEVFDNMGFKEIILIQAKTKQKLTSSVTVKELREFAGVMTSERATKGIMATNASVHEEAKKFMSKIPNLIVMEMELLFNLAVKHNVGIIKLDNSTPFLDAAFFIK